MTEERPADRLAVAITKAVEEFIAAEGGGMPRGYVLVLDYYDEDGEPAWATAYLGDQPPATSLGLLRWATLATEEQARAYLRRADDEDP